MLRNFVGSQPVSRSILSLKKRSIFKRFNANLFRNNVISNRTVLAIASSALISGSSLIRGSLAECNTPILVKENDHEDLIMAKIEHKLHPKIWQSYWEWLATILARLLYMLYNYSPVVGAMPLLLHPDEEIREYWWKIFVKAIQRGGPCSIKLAQWASTRTDLFPEIVCRHFRDLQSNQDDPDWREITKVFEKHYGPSWSEKLQLQRNEDGQIKLLGGGCVAKVLFGKLQSDDPLLNGSSIAVKVIHHNIKKRIVADTELLRTFAEMLEYWFPSIQQISLLDSVEEFSRMMLEQVDMRTEARSLDRFRQNFNEENKGKLYDEMLLQGKITNHVHFPAPYWEYTNEDVLVETYTPGYLIRDYMVHADAQHKKEIANIGLHTIFKMIFLDNFIHADLHPGNIVLLPAVSSKPHLAFIDAGLAVELKKEDRRNLVDLFKAVIINDGYAVGRLMIDRSRDASKVIDGDLFAHEMKAVVNEVHTVGLDLGKISISNLLQRVLMLCYQHQVKLEPRYATVIIALGVVEGLGRQLDPDVDILKRAAPYVMKASLMLATEYFTHKS